ncbi:MAG: glycoside hydrolase family 38 C-terminal domain-containing protein [Clostridiales bacterium]|nr:glycoside hydrolase family 38 C-terminal domain-containing protein [Clostridiales bacterium]
MLNEKQLSRCVLKLERFLETLDGLIFEKYCSLPASAFETDKQYHSVPDARYKPIKSGDIWGGESRYCWFRTSFTVPGELAGKALFLRPDVGGYEAMLFVDGKPMGTFATKIVVTGHGNHYCDMVEPCATEGRKLDLAVEFYTGHYVPGEMPLQTRPRSDFKFAYNSIDICTRNDLVAQTMFDLSVLIGLFKALDETSFRRADLLNVFYELHKVLWYSPEDVDRGTFEASLVRAREIMAPALAKKNNGGTVPYCGFIGHSHMDTAWLWHIAETVKKCARTYSNQLNLMAQYPEYKFVQSSSYHSEMIRENYPELFDRIAEKVAEGRYEPNGGVWVECDCNITGGESMIRQFLWGQRFTRKYFDGYTSDCFWLPDTFGYSAAIPQIMKGCEVDYFLTTKIAWNDTNMFPYDAFYWRGIDGTQVFTHFNKTHIGTRPDELMPLFTDKNNNDAIRQKNVSRSKLVSFGYGDGGGGPQWDQIEISRRLSDLEGFPLSEYTTVSDFMHRLEKEVSNPAVYSGELYLELHRGTLTNQHEIKRNNRLGEIALHNLEALTVANAVADGSAASDADFRFWQNRLLVNQFHDILPGTCITRANSQSKEEMTELLAEVGKLSEKALAGSGRGITVYNPMSFPRSTAFYVDAVSPLSGVKKQQWTTGVDGRRRLAVSGVTLEPYSARSFGYTRADISAPSAFRLDGDRLETPYAVIVFDGRGYISSFVDKASGRELRGEGYALNTFLMAEDLPAAWDNWDIDADIEPKFVDCAELLSREVVSDGCVEFRIRSVYRISPKSTVTQDMIFFADSPEVRFETLMDWNDSHRFLKTAFDTTIFSDFARQEIQFGYMKRPTTRNTSVEQAKFEVLNHKYTDLSEPNFGVSILNDSKYAISAYNGQLRLSLHKGGTRPDTTGDHGKHYCEYSFLPHSGGFNSENVVRPAYALNYKPVVARGRKDIPSLASMSDANLIIETVKPCEDSDRAFILRIYEAEGARTAGTLRLGFSPRRVTETNMLEEPKNELGSGAETRLTFRPFEIKTVRVEY